MNTENPSLFSLTWSSFIQHTVGAGSPVISTSRRSLFPATTVIMFLLPVPLQSRCILGGSFSKSVKRRRWEERGHSGEKHNVTGEDTNVVIFALKHLEDDVIFMLEYDDRKEKTYLVWEHSRS